MTISVIEFGEFKLDRGRFELSRSGKSVKLERKPLELLILLAEKNGQLVTRTEIAEQLWDSEVFVDTEHGINTAIRKIRHVLRDDPEHPSFLQTVTGKGYRFIGTIAEVADPTPPEISRNTLEQPQPLSVATSELVAPDRIDPTQAKLPAAESPPTAQGMSSGWLWPAILIASALAILLLSVVWIRHRQSSAARPIRSVAVIPLDNFSGDPNQEYFADGMTDELTTMLAKTSTLDVISRTSVMQFKGAHRPLQEIARALHVDAVLEGSISRSAGRVHMTLQLIRADSDTHLWAESYDRSPQDSVSLPSEAARAIATQLHAVATPPALSRSIRPEAHDAYLKGLYLWYGGNNEAGKYFQQAIDLQPDYAAAWAGMSDYYTQSAFDDPDPDSKLSKAEACAARALELDPLLPQAHFSMGSVLFLFHRDWERGDQEIERAIELDPRFAQALHTHAIFLAALNRQAEAIEEQKKSTEAAPSARPWSMPRAYYWARRYDDVIQESEIRLQAPGYEGTQYYWLSQAYRAKGMEKEAAAYLEKTLLYGASPDLVPEIHHAYQQGGYKGLTRWQLKRLQKQSQTEYVTPLNFAEFYAKLGDHEKTIAYLQQASNKWSRDLIMVQCDSIYDFLHADPRYRAIVRRIGLPPAY